MGEGVKERTAMKYYQDMTITNAVWIKCDCKILIEEDDDDDEVEAGSKILNKKIVEEVRKRKRRYRKKRGKNDKKCRWS